MRNNEAKFSMKKYISHFKLSSLHGRNYNSNLAQAEFLLFKQVGDERLC